MRRIVLALGALVVVAAVVLLVARPGGSAANVETATVTRDTLESTIELAGTVAAHDSRTLAFGSGGRVAEVKVAAGDTVEAGEVLATLDSTVAEAQLAAATAAIESADAAKASADAALKAAKGTGDARVKAAQAQVSAAEAQQAAAKAQLAQAQLATDNLTLTSPIAGTVVTVGLKAGDLAGASGGLSAAGAGTIVVADLSTLQVDTSASEIDVVALKAAMPVSLTFDALPELTLEGTICELGKVGSGTGGVIEFPVTVCLAGQSAELRAGMTANVSIVLARADDALIVPAQAIRTVDGKPSVRVLGADGTVTTVTVEVGISSGTRTQIVSGVKEGDKVVLGDSGTGG